MKIVNKLTTLITASVVLSAASAEDGDPHPPFLRGSGQFEVVSLTQQLGIPNLHRKLTLATPDIGKVYTSTADFNQGSAINLNTANDEVKLNDEGQPFHFIWVAASGRGTVVKIDTRTGTILGEYWTAPSNALGNPSRTTVDQDGSVWCGNRNPVYDGYGSVVHIGLLENGQCEDRNHNNVIDTSTGLGDIKPWTVTEDPEDECIIHYVRVNGDDARHVSVNKDNNVWVSGVYTRNFDLIQGGGPTVSGAGTIIRQENAVGFGGYGGLISGDVIWSASPLLRWDTNLPLTGDNGDPSGPSIGPPIAGRTWAGQTDFQSYGLCVDSAGNVWNTELASGFIHKYDSNGVHLGQFSHGNLYAQGCVVDSRMDGTDDVWVAHSLLQNAASVGHLKNDGTYVGTVILNEQSGTTGVAVDAAGKIWATNYYSNSVSRIDPAAGDIGEDGVTPVGAVDFTVELGAGATPYDYSDMTGSTIEAGPTTGTWSVVFDSNVDGYGWSDTTISWESLVPDHTSLEVKVTSSNDGSTFGAPLIVTNDSLLTSVPNGRYLKIEVVFGRPNDQTASPVLHGLSITNFNQNVCFDSETFGIDAMCVANCGNACLEVCEHFGIEFHSRKQCRNAGSTKIDGVNYVGNEICIENFPNDPSKWVCCKCDK